MRLILQTRHGGLNNGANWFALTWLQVTDFSDLNISPQTYHPGLYLLAPLPKSEKEKKPRTAYVREKATARTAHVLVQASPRTAHVREKALITDSPRTAHVHNEYIPIPNASNIVEVIL